MHLTRIADRTPDKPAVVMADGSRTVTYAELDRRSRQVAQLLRARGLGVRDHVAHCRTSLAGFKCPRAVEFMTELTRLPTGKLLRRRVRAQYEDTGPGPGVQPAASRETPRTC